MHLAQQFRHPGAVAGGQQSRVIGVQPDPGPGGLADSAGQPVVVGVDVRDQDRAHVGDGAAGFHQPLLEGVPGLGRVPAGVDERVGGVEVGLKFIEHKQISDSRQRFDCARNCGVQVYVRFGKVLNEPA